MSALQQIKRRKQGGSFAPLNRDGNHVSAPAALLAAATLVILVTNPPNESGPQPSRRRWFRAAADGLAATTEIEEC
jgi:hypothetical protein